jgi:hypothetical protein
MICMHVPWNLIISYPVWCVFDCSYMWMFVYELVGLLRGGCIHVWCVWYVVRVVCI